MACLAGRLTNAKLNFDELTPRQRFLSAITALFRSEARELIGETANGKRVTGTFTHWPWSVGGKTERQELE